MIACYEMNELKAQKRGAERYCASTNEIYSRQNVRYTNRRKLYRVSDVFEEGYNEPINVAINFALTCIA